MKPSVTAFEAAATSAFASSVAAAAYMAAAVEDIDYTEAVVTALLAALERLVLAAEQQAEPFLAAALAPAE